MNLNNPLGVCEVNMEELDLNKLMERAKLMTEFVDWAFQGIATKEEFTARLGLFIEEYTFGKLK